MATVLPGSPSGPVPLLDLSFLTEEEKMVILRVLKADEELRRVELGEQQRVIEQERHTQKVLSENKQCTCGKSFESNEGATCPECKYLVCSQCQKKMEGVPCSVCFKERLAELQSLDYMPILCTNNPPPSLYGSELIRRSLEALTNTEKETEEDDVTSPKPVMKQRNTLLDEPTENAFNGIKSSTPDPHSTIIHHSESIDSLSSAGSIYRQPCRQQDYSITGKLNVGVWYSQSEEQLIVRINHAKGLSAVGENGTSNPYVKVFLLPDKSKLTKRKTAIQKKTLNPVYNETLKYELLQADIASRTLWLSVWDCDECGTNQFQGEVRLPLVSTDLNDFTDHEYNLQEMVCSVSQAQLKTTPVTSIRPEGKHSDETTDVITPLISISSSDNLSISAEGKCLPTNSQNQSSGSLLPVNTPRRSGSRESLQSNSTRFPPRSIPIASTSSKMKHAGSVSSVSSMTSLSRPSRGDYDITGDILLGVEYKKKQLMIHVKKARGLTVPDTGSGSINSYVKIYLLPDRSKHSKRTTNVKKKTFNPVYSETLKYQVPREELTTRVIWLTVWDHSTSRFLGELCLFPSTLNLSNSPLQWYKLQDYAEPSRVPPSTRTSSSSKPLAMGPATPLKTVARPSPSKTLLKKETPVEVKRNRAAATPLRAVAQSKPQRRLLSEETPAKTKEYFRGFEAFAETSFIIAQSHSSSFEWQGCGLKLHIPEGAVQTEHRECRIDVKAGFAGQFTFPDDSQLVSCVYWFSCSKKFLTPVTIEIQHCTSPHDPSQLSSLHFVTAKSSEAELPYQFKALNKGTFSQHSSYGSIQVSRFSFFGITIDKVFQRCRRYCGHLYYTRKGSNKWHLEFVITWNLPAYLKAIQGARSSAATSADLQFEVQFEGDSISLELPEDGVVLPNGWAIRPLGPLVITKQQVDEFNAGQQAPCCRLQVKLEDGERPVELEHKVKLLGAKTGFNFFTVTCTPEDTLKEPSGDSRGNRKLPGESEPGDA